MGLRKKYIFNEAEPRWLEYWRQSGVYDFDRNPDAEVYSIDTPPATVSGHLHLGHVYSYSHTDFVARFWRMRGKNVFYPMGFDDNGLPTDRYVEKRLGVASKAMGRAAFIDTCLKISAEAEKDYRHLWERLGFSIDWRYTYRTIEPTARKIAQLSFLRLLEKGLAYHREAPALWCPECQASIAQADIDDLERESEYVTLAFKLPDGSDLPIATTRPELLAACVAVFIHPTDERYKRLAGQYALTPLFGQAVPVLRDDLADPNKGTGAVMCCTFGDAADVAWWYQYKLPCIRAISPEGTMTEAAGSFAGLTIHEARRQVKAALVSQGAVLGQQPTRQTVRVHERCDTPVETIMARQWFVSLLDHKGELIEAGKQVNWIPEHMGSRYQVWVENLNWDWCLSRQRYFGIPFPVWYCQICGEVVVPDEGKLPVDPLQDQPDQACPKCGRREFKPEADVMDTWATSSLSPQIVGNWLEPDKSLYHRVFPYTLRSQAHDIIRTWAFYTIVQSMYHFGKLPWTNAAISGWGIAGPGMGKISKSRGGGPMAPLDLIDRFSADGLRYWAASTGPGKDAVISEEKIQMGGKLAVKLWNVARFAERFIEGYHLPELRPSVSPADRWILARLQKVILRMTECLEGYDYAAAKSELESFFWTELADNYLEMCKQRLYAEGGTAKEAAVYTLYLVFGSVLQLFAPFLPFITEEIYQALYRQENGRGNYSAISVHLTEWPKADPSFENEEAEAAGAKLVEIATAVRRYKSEHNLPLGGELSRVKLATAEDKWVAALQAAREDLMSITRAREIEVVQGEERIEIEEIL